MLKAAQAMGLGGEDACAGFKTANLKNRAKASGFTKKPPSARAAANDRGPLPRLGRLRAL